MQAQPEHWVSTFRCEGCGLRFPADTLALAPAVRAALEAGEFTVLRWVRGRRTECLIAMVCSDACALLVPIRTLAQWEIAHGYRKVYSHTRRYARTPGRGSVLDGYAAEIVALLAQHVSQHTIATRYHVSQRTVSGWVRKHQMRRSRHAA